MNSCVKSAISSVVALSMMSGPALAQDAPRAQWSRSPVEATGIPGARNVILFIGDGMNMPTVAGARILEAQMRGESGETNRFSFELFPHTAVMSTYAYDAQVTDSAVAMTAMMTGVKTNNDVISANPNVKPGDTILSPADVAVTLLEIAEHRGMSTGVVSTTRVTHATPAACFSHSTHRDWESDNEVPAAAKASAKDIARQTLEPRNGDGMEVVLGGGRTYYLPKTVADPEYKTTMGRRQDGRDLTTEWTSKGSNWKYVWNSEQFKSIDPAHTDHLLGLFEPSHMQYDADRPKDTAGEPSVAEMTEKAIRILQKNDRGFFLMVEGGRIDHAHHDSNAYRAFTDTIAMDAAVKKAMELTRASDTLILVTADHGHVITFAGYATKGNPILGLVKERSYGGGSSTVNMAKDADGMPYTTIQYSNGPVRFEKRPDLTTVDTTAMNYKQEAGVKLTTGDTHSGEDVAVYAAGAGSHLVHGAIDNTDLFHIMMRALGFDWSK